MNAFMMARHRLDPGDILLTGRLHLPEDQQGFWSGAAPAPPTLEIECECPGCGQTARFWFPDKGEPQLTQKLDLAVPAVRKCACEPRNIFVTLDTSRQDHIEKLEAFSRLRRAWYHERDSKRPEIAALAHQYARTHTDLVNFKW